MKPYISLSYIFSLLLHLSESAPLEVSLFVCVIFPLRSGVLQVVSRATDLWPLITTIAERTRLNQLQNGLTGLKKASESQYNELKKSTKVNFSNLDTEIATLKRQKETIVQQLAILTGEIQKRNPHVNPRDSSSNE